MAAASIAASLAQLIGLGESFYPPFSAAYHEPTVAQQILPYITSIKTAQQVSNYLETLLPPGQASRALIQAYLAQRFPPARAASRPQPPRSSSTATKADPWGTAKPTPASRTTAAAPTRAPNAAAMQSQFASTGKVYVKNRDDPDQGRWGGGGTASSSRANSSSRARSGTTTPIPPPMAPSSFSSSAATRSSDPPVHHHINDMSSLPTPQSISLSETGRSQLATLDTSLKSLRLRLRPSPSSSSSPSKRACFCSARYHPLSPYSPLCPSCGLVLCSLNPPSFPCPSCQHPHLISAPLLESHINTLETQRSEVLERERRRTEAEKEQEALERAAIRFPELGGGDRAHVAQGAGSGRMGYADLVGGGRAGALDIQARIERGYAQGRTAGGREFGGGGAGGGGRGAPQRVLRLDMKTSKVKVQTKTKVIKKSEPKLDREKADYLEKEEEVDEWEGSRWIDESDDGWRLRNGLLSLDDTTTTQADRDATRPFLNLTLDEKDQPLWIEPLTIDSEPLPSTIGVDIDLEANTGRRNVPGAAPSKVLEGKKNKRSRRAKTEEATSSSAVGA
ncbi:BZ3500_MvSof-1268-A1-R1_Chr2-2g05118 [Microbotryum saponariae]|uniref:BZ3500_MvSof-1268-A1-R1_Chr2-2g05118 protein n=1 Tax=Microbotryum saponariae TaxID=289078 RepID=A0A2X0K4P0_9BASI|nr:BZ3500_MvSof-1268-A1-R1_Chr2-2g05118 [Microbotryum saponariae]SDA00945.1 BZ3501_MvSof-1269-A2-R1_Chr2-2g04792 [Microbotryum saponariae]